MRQALIQDTTVFDCIETIWFKPENGCTTFNRERLIIAEIQ